MLIWSGILIFVVSFVFSMLGLGGGMLYVPIFHWLGFGLKDVVIPLGLLLNGLNTLIALIPYGKKHLVDWKGGLPMALSALIMAPIGALLARYVPNRLLLILFAIMVLIAAVRTLWVANRPDKEMTMSVTQRAIIGSIVAGLAGFLGGMLGIGGGFIIGPLLMWIGYKTKEAAATTAYIVTFSSFSGFLGHTAHMSIQAGLLTITILSVIVASLLGSWFMANRAKPTWVKWFYGLLLVGVAVKMIIPVL
ncbi:sulfite exporter TauE/SafE family protein [Alicyclobacillaceae bacterium I2511]|nr:sulfite exporter TauE/SafE family protein [Alicyclobacillaceae bacterium I2511]